LFTREANNTPCVRKNGRSSACSFDQTVCSTAVILNSLWYATDPGMSRQFLPLDFITGRIIWAYGFLGHPEFNVFKFIDATAIKVEQREKLESQSRWSVGDFFRVYTFSWKIGRLCCAEVDQKSPAKPSATRWRTGSSDTAARWRQVAPTTASGPGRHSKDCLSTSTITRKSQHSQECKDPRRQCFCDFWPWLLTFWPRNKWVSRIHLWPFLCQVWWSVFEISCVKTDIRQTDKNPAIAIFGQTAIFTIQSNEVADAMEGFGSFCSDELPWRTIFIIYCYKTTADSAAKSTKLAKYCFAFCQST